MCDNICNSEVVMKIVLPLWFVILLAGCAPALTPVPSPVEESPTPAATWTPVPPFIFLFP
ncbi:MAG: hypothetical protein KJZ57_01555 [Anaerolineales bacterium]|nr:hypothetical protein [Anaerolineales bacterium]